MKLSDLEPAELKWLRIKESLKGLSDTDIVSRWYLATDQEDWRLTERQDAMRQRIDFAKGQFLKRKKYNDIREALMNEFGVSIAQAQIDIRRAMNLFGDIDKIPKEAHRQRTIQMALDTFKVAKSAGDTYGMAKATEVYFKAAGLDKDETERVDIEKMMSQRTYVEVLDPKLREMLLNFLRISGGSIDVTKLFNHISAVPDGEYIDYETATDDDAGIDPAGD